MKGNQRGDAGVAMVAVMLVMMVGFFWYGGMRHGGDREGHRPDSPHAERSEKTPLELLDETYARGQITREEYLQRRADLMRR